MVCPLCRERKARRTCPAIGEQICAVCCGTKRLTEIDCPPDCTWLASARAHPPAATIRKRVHDVSRMLDSMRDLGEQQSRLFLLLLDFLARYEPEDLHAPIDADVSDAAAALAATYETAARGVIYQHRPASLPAERLATALQALLTEAGGTSAGSAFERSAAVVLRRIEDAARSVSADEPANRRAFLDLLGRVTKPVAALRPPGPAEPGRLIVP